MPTAYLQVENLTKSFGSHVLFEGLSFGIAQGQRIGLIARNGAGKSTLLEILAGREGYDRGSVTYRSNLHVGYLPQGGLPLPLDSPRRDVRGLTVRKYMNLCTPHDDAATALTELEAELHQLGITNLEATIGELSGGQVKRVALAMALTGHPDLLILDEPTNHLDLTTIEWLEGVLCHSTATLLMVTHDRYFLDNVCSTIMEMDDRTVYAYQGNYSYYLEKRQERLDARNAEIARAANLYRTELDWMRRMPCARGHKARYREEAFYELEKVAKQSVQKEQIQLKSQASYIGNKIVELHDVSFAYPEHVILSHFNYIFARYEKVGIVGDNGAGKTTFIRLLQGLLAPDGGRIETGTTVRFGYYSQEGLSASLLTPESSFDDGIKVIDVVRKIADYIPMGDGTTLSAAQLLQHFLFSPAKQHDYVSKLSGGERRRLYLCTVLMGNPNFLILDEPTNDLDILTLQILEEYLREWKGCLVVVSHDRYFMDKMVDHLLVFHGDGTVQDFPGNYSQYRERRKNGDTETRKDGADGRGTRDTAKTTAKGSNRAEAPKTKLTYKEKREYEQLEHDIEALEAEKEQIQEALCSGTLSVDELTRLSKRLPQLNDELDEKSMRWLELSEYSM